MEPVRLPTPDAVERAVATVYARPEFAPPPPTPIRDWLAEIWAAIGAALGRLFGGLGLGAEGAQLLAWLVIGLLSLTAVVALFRLLGRLPGRRHRSVPAEDLLPGAAPAAPATAADWEAAARRAAEAGRWRDAVLALYPALLLRLDARGALRVDPAKTPGDYRREARRDADAARTLDGFLRLFEPVAFGARSVDRRGFERLLALATGADSRG